MSRRLTIAALAAGCSLLAAAPASAVTRYVDDGGAGAANCITAANPCPTIALANGVSGPGDVIEVGGGTYAGSSLGSGVSLVESNFNPPQTAGDAVIDGAANGILVVPGAAREIRGFTIEGDSDAIELQGGAAATTVSIIGNTFPSRDTQFDSRIQISDGAGAANVTIESNAWTFGAGPIDPSLNRIGVDDQTNGPLNAVVRSNSFDAVSEPLKFVGSDPLIVGNTMTRVYEDTGGTIKRAIDLADSSATVEGNSITADVTSGIGIIVNNSGAILDSPVLRRNSVTGFDSDALNVRGNQGTADTVTVSDSLFTVTGASFAVSGQDLRGPGSLSLTGVTLDKPSASPLFVQEVRLLLDSSILSGGIAPFNSTCTSTFSRGSTSGTPGDLTNCDDFATTAPPGFVGGGDFHLAPGSAMIDAGNPAASSGFDLDFGPRAIDASFSCANPTAFPRRDIGAYEYFPSGTAQCPAPGPVNPITSDPRKTKCKKPKKKKRSAGVQTAAKKKPKGCKKKKRKKK